MKQHVLLTGGSGLLALNWALAVKDRFLVTLGLHKRNVALSGVHAKTINLESVDHIVQALLEITPDVVVHTTGITSVEQCEKEPAFAHHVNVTLAENVAKACEIAGAKMVHISTDHLYSGKDALVCEAKPLEPINVYGQTKAMAEARVLEANSDALVIRTNFYGWGPSYRHSFSDVVINALRADLNLVLFQDVFFTPILIETAVIAVHDLICLKANGVYNVVGDERTSKYIFGLRIAEQFNLNPNNVKTGLISDRTDLVSRPSDMSLSNHKLCIKLGRTMGGIKEQLSRLHRQEIGQLNQEIKAL